MINLLGISGSLRSGSYNTLLVREAARVFGDANFTLANLRVPLFDADVEAASGPPQEVKDLYAAMSVADAVIISTPEYNGNISGVLKNALDWVSRTKPMPMQGVPISIMSAAAGRAGGVRAQYGLRLALAAFRPIIIPGPEIGIAGAQNEFDDAGRLTNERYSTALHESMGLLRATVAALKSSGDAA